MWEWKIPTFFKISVKYWGKLQLILEKYLEKLLRNFGIISENFSGNFEKKRIRKQFKVIVLNNN